MSFSRGDASRLPLAIICRAFGAQSFFDVLFQGRRASRLPLAVIFRAFGAQSFFDVLFQATRFALAPGYYMSRLRRLVFL